jgi:serine/threonine protein kinase
MRQDRKWRHRKGAADLIDLALNYEQLLLMAALCGTFPASLVKAGRYRISYFEEDNELRFRPTIPRVSLRDRLRRNSSLRGKELSLATDLLRQCLTIDPERRITAKSAISHPWLEQN